MINNEKSISNVGILQINLGHRVVAHDLLMAWLTLEKKDWLICVQEPYFSQKGLSKLPQNYGAYWVDNSDKKRKRALILAPKFLHGYMVTQSSTKDCVIIRLDKLGFSLASMYCAQDVSIKESVKGVLEEALCGKKIICCADTNAHHALWGSMIHKGTQTSTKNRGKELVECLDDNDFVICNEPPHPPTFVHDSGKKSSHIDITFCSLSISESIRDWHVSDQIFDSDHKALICNVQFMKDRNFNRQNTDHAIPWKKPSAHMYEIMKGVLQSKVHYVGRNIRKEGVDEIISNHTKMVVGLLDKIFRKKANHNQKVFWWTKEVDAAHKELKTARRKMRKYKYQKFRDIFNNKRWVFRNCVRKAKLDSWIGFTTAVVDPWDRLIRIIRATQSGKMQARTLCDLTGRYSNSLDETLHFLGNQFYPKPASLTPVHVQIENTVDALLVNVQKGPKLTICELRKALSEMSASTAPGYDKITNNVLHILCAKPTLEKQYLALYNSCLSRHYFPTNWKSAKIILIPKATGDTNSTKAFRPISLTSVFAKLFERMILARLLHYLALSNKLVSNQHAYTKGCSTTTALYELFETVQFSIHRKRVGGLCAVVFLDITGAFDCTWHYGILYKLLTYGVPKYIVLWLKSFLADRTATFHQGDVTHTVHLKQGCPQGGVLSPILWNVLFNDMLAIPIDAGKKKSDRLKVVGYADDAAIVCKADSIEEIESMLNNHLKKIKVWADEHRVKFNASKLAVLTITSRINIPPSPMVFYDNHVIQSVDRYKYLGLLVDQKLSWYGHIKLVIDKLASVTRSLRGLSRGNWGISLQIYRMLFHAIFIPIMTYGIVIWGWKASSKFICAKFDKEIRRYAIMATRCQRSTASSYIFQLLKTQPFSQILQQEVLKVSVNQLHVVATKRWSVYENYERNRISRIVPQSMDHYFYLLRKPMYNEICDIEFFDVNNQYAVHPTQWVTTNVVIHDSVSATFKGLDSRGWVIYTDASSSSYGIGWGIAAFKHGICESVLSGSLSKCNIYTAEAYALFRAVKFVNALNGLSRFQKVEIRCDCQGLVRTLEKFVHSSTLLFQIKDELRLASISGKNIVIRWIPSHQGILGNEFVDGIAKKAVDRSSITLIPKTVHDFNAAMKRKINLGKCSMWNNFDSRIVKTFLPKYCDVQKFVQSMPSVGLCQLVSGHCCLNDFVHNKLKLISSPKCECGLGNETTDHFLFECRLHEDARKAVWDDFILRAMSL